MKNINNTYLSKFLFFSVIILSSFLIFKAVTPEQIDNDNKNLSSLLKKTKSEINTGHKVQISVLNGCGIKGVADLYTNFLRNTGYDVIDYGNAPHFEFKKTKLLVHNKNHKNFIYEIVDLLELNPQQLEYNYDKNIFYDLTLVIGADYSNLNSYSEVSMHYEPF